MTKTILCKLIAIKEGIYTVYVFQNENKQYVMCTKLPNWDVLNLNRGDEGFLTYEEAKAGESYINPNFGICTYKYSNLYFKNFIHKQKEDKHIIIV